MHKFNILYFVLFITALVFANPKKGVAVFMPYDTPNDLSAIKDSPEKVDSLLVLSEACMGSNPDKATAYCNLAYQIATKINYVPGEKDALYALAQIQKTKGHLDSAIAVIRTFVKLSENSTDSIRMGKGYLQLGNLLRRKGDNDAAQVYYNQSKSIYESLDDYQGLISVSNALGIIFKNNSQYDSACFYYMQTLKLCEIHNFRKGIGPSMINLGKFYMVIGENELAKSYNLNSIAYSKESNNLPHVALAYTNVGILEMQSEEYDSALVYYDLAIGIQKQLGNIIGLNNLYINKGNLFISKKDFPGAIKKFDLALEAFDEIGYLTGYITALQSKAEALSKLGYHKKASQLFDSSLQMAVETDNLELQKNIYSKIFQNHLEAKDYKNALEYKTKFFEIRDSLLTLEKQNYIADLRLKYDKEKDQARILALTNENLEKDLQIRKRTNQRNIYLFSSSGIISIIIFLLIFYRAKTKNDNYLAMQKIRQLEKDKRLISVQFLLEGQEEERKRIAKELHDGIGVLLSTAKMQFTSIDGITPANKPKINNATKLLEMAASEVRKITHNMMPGLLSKYGFYEAIEDLLDQINEAGTIQTSFRVKGDQKRFPETKEFMLYRIVQEMINNTLKHAAATSIKIRVEVSQHRLGLYYSDDGKGFDMQEKLHNKSIGLTSIKSRVTYLGGHLELDSTPGKGTKYKFNISIR